MIIRRAKRKDLDQLAYLFNRYRSFYKQDNDLKKARSFLGKRMKRDESVILVAEENGRLVGFTQLFPIFTSVGLQRSWLLNDLYVEEGARNSGVGTGLLEEAKEFCRSKKAKWVMLQTASDNLPAQRVYEKNGWKKEADLFYRFDL